MYQRNRSQNHSQDWDPMREEYENSTYAPQYHDDDTNTDGGVQLDHCKLYVTNIPKTLKQEGLRNLFSKYGNCLKIFLSNDPSKRYALIWYETPSEAKLAMMKLNKTDPLQLNINVAHKKTYQEPQNQRSSNNQRSSMNYRDDGSVSSKSRYSRKLEEVSNGENNNDDDIVIDDDLGLLDDGLDTNLVLEIEELKLKHLKLQEAQIQCKQRMLLLNRIGKNTAQKPAVNRCMLPDGRIVVRNTNERTEQQDVAFSSAAGDSRAMSCSCEHNPWNEPGTSDSSTPSTCVLCSKDKDKKDKSDLDFDRYVKSVNSVTRSVDVSQKSDKFKMREDTKKAAIRSDCTKKSDRSDDKRDVKLVRRSDLTCVCDSDDDFDETDRLIQLRDYDYIDIVDDNMKIVIALSGYPKSKMQLKQMERFQRSLHDVMDMQLKAGLLKKTPTFLDYYLNRGAIVCICKNVDSRDWVVRIIPGLQERMGSNLVLLKAKVKRLCLGVIKTPKSSWPATAQDAFKLLQYFNPNLKTHLWKIYSQKIIDDVESTSFIIDRVSGEFIRGPSFKNVIDYNQMVFELMGNTEIYYDSYLSDMNEDLSSVASRVKLLQEIKSNDSTPRNLEIKDDNDEENEGINDYPDEASDRNEQTFEIKRSSDDQNKDVDADKGLDVTVTKYVSDDQSACNRDDIWITETDNLNCNKTVSNESKEVEVIDASTSTIAISEQTESFAESFETVTVKNSNLNIDSSRGIAYNRRTNYLHVENELKISLVLDGYPQNKLEGTHIRRLKHLFKDYLHKDMKLQRFCNMIIPKFHDVYLSNGAVIYVCDSLESRDYLMELLPKFINSTGLKLNFRDVNNLVRYTRIIMKLPQELSNVESHDILYALKMKYPKLNPDGWKYYSDVAGKQKRQFGVDPISLEVIKCPSFDPIYEGKTISFRIIDRQKRDSTKSDCDFKESEYENDETKKLKQELLHVMYSPIESDIMNVPLTRIRTNHYSDLVADDLKLYVGPANYPETRIDEMEFYSIKRTMNNIVFGNYDGCFESVPRFRDIYLFDGVIFIICQNMSSRVWVEENVANINAKMSMNLKVTEFRGAVGIISMVVRTDKDADEVISLLQKQNPRLRTKFWRKINTVHTRTKLDVVLQIDKLSAQIITDKDFNGTIGDDSVEFKLGHLKSMLKPKMSIHDNSNNNISTGNSSPSNHILAEKTNPNIKDENVKLVQEKFNSTFFDKGNEENSPRSMRNLGFRESNVFFYTDIDKNSDRDSVKSFRNNAQGHCKMVLKVPMNILPESKDGLEVILDLLEDKNPGLNTELWKVEKISQNNRGKFNILIDKHSASIIKGEGFDPTIGGERLKFLL
ncbi:uncharacterized protein LOC125075261 isoform X1 [Vanessa atalanta]|uniref:uncharacterized protein LOC125075261 isoform X1 n=1 Tax=Vanessa atalanta TaxID=42275 RepID=UPI001FCD1CF3|nr:uncharacterized protein LOC125075261 isoform X1 [Vanessa atalanta]